MPNNETELILEKIRDLKESTCSRITDLREFQLARHNDITADIAELKKDNKSLVKKVDEYITNHFSYHKSERKTLWRWIFILMGVAIVISATGLAPYLLPYILSFFRLIPL